MLHLEYLKGLTRLQHLDLDKVAATDAGLEHLTGLTKLKSLTLRGPSQFTREGREKLRQALPTCDMTLGERSSRDRR